MTETLNIAGSATDGEWTTLVRQDVPASTTPAATTE